MSDPGIMTGKVVPSVKLIFTDYDELNDWLQKHFPEVLQPGHSYYHTVDILVSKKAPLEALAEAAK